MIFSKNNIGLAFLFASLLNISSLYAQEFTSFKAENKSSDSLLLALNTKIINVDNEDIAIITPSSVPASKLYHNNWNNTDVRLNSEKMFDKNATYVLTLVNKNDNDFVFPFKGKIISPFGYRGRRIHTGTDIKLKLNEEVYAAFDGVVRMAKRYSGYGNIVVIRHANGLETCYSHLNKIKVKVNQEVKSGDLVGLGGRTGRATTTHLHFETRFLGQPFNPEIILDFENYSLKSDSLIIDKNTFIKAKKAKKYKYIKNKKGKRVKVYINDEKIDNEKSENTELAITQVSDTNIFLVYNDLTNKVDTLTVFTPRESKEETINKTISNNNIEKNTEKIKVSKKVKNQKTAIYKVRSGDTLSRIAQKNGTTVKALCKLNKINEDAILSLGKKLKVK
jgi:murein DD-endopeptidase MepM/ murein hydrolase activator NlpD